MDQDAEFLVDAARLAHARAQRAEFSGLEVLRDRLRRNGHPTARAWESALAFQAWLAAPLRTERPDVASIEAALGGPALSQRAAMACAVDLALASFIGFGGAELPRLQAVLTERAADLDAEQAAAAVVRAFAALSEGDAPRGREAADAASRLAAAEKSPGLLVLATALRALGSSADGDLPGALGVARRASLMGRTEGIPHAEFLAHLSLARIRRLSGHPHLALRIATALRGVVSEPWNGWLEWEWTFAGGDPGVLDSTARVVTLATRSAAATEALRRLLDCARTGRRAAFDEASAALAVATAETRFFGAEAAELVAAIDPDALAPTTALRHWRTGATVFVPAALHGLRLRPDESGDGETAAGYVRASLEAAPSRLLHWGLPLSSGDGVMRLKQSQRTEGRVECLLSILALSGAGGIPEASLFAEAYGFPFVPEVHLGVFDVLLHRARAQLAEGGVIVRAGGIVRLRPARVLLIPDPRTSQRITDRVLRLLSRKGSSSAKDAANGLGVSLRAAQSALRTLAEDGACQVVREGRNVAYLVEDTVFSEPTQRLNGLALAGVTKGV